MSHDTSRAISAIERRIDVRSRRKAQTKKIVLVPQYVWQLDAMHFKDAPAGRAIYSEEEYAFKLSESNTLKFRFVFRRKTCGSEYAGFGLEIKSLPPSKSSVSGRSSIIVDEVEFCSLKKK